MSKKATSKKRTGAKAPRTKISSNVPYESGFHFYTALDNYSGITATNLGDFAAKLQVVSVESIVFHNQRKDFQKWIKEIIGDKELAKRLSIFGEKFPAEDLRKEILRIVQERLAETSRFDSLSQEAHISAAVPMKV
jgi:hypothetical protein